MDEQAKVHRSAKTTRQQFTLYLDELEKSRALQSHNGQVPEIVEEAWTGLCSKLNSSGGPRKTIPEWKKVFTGWKYSTRKKARQLLVAQKQTGGGPPEKPLTDMEQRLITITGQAAVTGIAGIAELGLANTVPQNDDGLNHIVNEETNTVNFENVTPTSKTVDEVKTPVTKKRRTLTSSLQSYLANTNHPEEQILTEIGTSLKQLVKIEKKKLLLAEIKLKLKYEHVDFDLNLSSDED